MKLNLPMLTGRIEAIRTTHEYKDIARGLGESGVISRSLSERLINMAGYRNRIVHFYHEITGEELYHILQTDLGDIRLFLKEIAKFIETHKSSEAQ